MGANPLKKRLVPKRQLMVSVLIGIVTLLVVFVLVAFSITPIQYDIQVGEVAPATLTATRDVTDQISTLAAQEQARSEVSPMYTMNNAVTQEVQQKIAEYFAAVKTAAETLRDEYIRWQVKESNYGITREYYLGIYDPEKVDWSTFLTKQLKDDVRTVLGDTNMPDNAVIALAAMTPEQVQKMASDVGNMARVSLEGGVRVENLQAEKSSLRSAIEAIYPEAGGYIAYFPIKSSFAANMILDEAATQQARDAAAASVAPIIYKQNQTIVVGGQVVTESQLAVLVELGLVGGEEINYMLYVGVFLFLTLLSIV